MQIKIGRVRYTISYMIREGNKETILYLHGLGSTKYDFFPAMYLDALKDYGVVAIDFPGCGNSDYQIGQPITVDIMVEIINEVVTKLALANLIVIGHSMGGISGLLYSHRYPKLVKSFINIEGNLAPEDCFWSRNVVKYSYEEFLQEKYLEKLEQSLSDSSLLGMRICGDRFRRQVTPQAFYDYCVSVVDHSDNSDLMSKFINLNIKKALIYGSSNKSLSYLPSLKKTSVNVIEIPNSGHYPHFSNPKYFYKKLEEFICTD